MNPSGALTCAAEAEAVELSPLVRLVVGCAIVALRSAAANREIFFGTPDCWEFKQQFDHFAAECDMRDPAAAAAFPLLHLNDKVVRLKKEASSIFYSLRLHLRLPGIPSSSSFSASSPLPSFYLLFFVLLTRGWNAWCNVRCLSRSSSFNKNVSI